MTIQIDAEQWPIAAGCIGLTKLFATDDITITRTGIELRVDMLDDLAERYFKVLITEFSNANRAEKRVTYFRNQIRSKKESLSIGKVTTDLQKQMNDQYKKIKSYFADTKECEELADILKEVKKIKSNEESEEVLQLIDRYLAILYDEAINERLTLNYVKAEILKRIFYGQTSFLQLSFFPKSLDEHILKMKQDFIEPARLELAFAELVTQAVQLKEVYEFLEENSHYPIFKNLLKVCKKLTTLDEFQTYLKDQVLHCTFCEELIATQSFEELVFSPLIFSGKSSHNFKWNFEKNAGVPISAVARLVLFLAPLGMSFNTRRIGNGTVSENYLFGSLILSQQYFSEIVNVNHTYHLQRKDGSAFSDAIVGMLQSNVDKSKRLNDSNNSYLFIEMHSNIDLRKTLLDYYHMPSYLVKYLVKYGNTMKLILNRPIQDQFFRVILQGIDPKKVLFDYLRLAIKEPIHAEGVYHTSKGRVRLMEAKKGKSMETFDKLVQVIFYKGRALRKALLNEGATVKENKTYKASGKKKLEGIAYRLLNAAKSGNKAAFLDTVFRLYLSSGLEVPQILIEHYKKESLDFETISSVFIAGLLSEEINNKEQKEEEKVNG